MFLLFICFGCWMSSRCIRLFVVLMFIDHHSCVLVICHSSGIVTLHHSHAFTIVGFFFICYLFLFSFLLGHGIQHSIVLVVLHHSNVFIVVLAFWFSLLLVWTWCIMHPVDPPHPVLRISHSGSKRWWTLLGIEISCSQWKAQGSTQGALLLFLLNFGRRG